MIGQLRIVGIKPHPQGIFQQPPCDRSLAIPVAAGTGFGMSTGLDVEVV